MNTTHFKWLVKREFWEHKGGFFWAPVVISALMTVFLMIGIGGAIYAGSSGNLFMDDGKRISLATLSEHIDESDKIKIAEGIAHGFLGASMPLFITLAFVVFFYCLSSLYDDRRDRSILFWKSLPVSDSNTVLSKLFSAAVMAPLITIILAIVVCYAYAFLLMGLCAVYGINVFGHVLAQPNFYTAALGFIAVLPIFILWAMPTIGWLMMVSAWAKRVPFVWAVGVPIIGAAMVSAVAGVLNLNLAYDVLWAYIGRLLLSIAPGSWFGVLEWENRMPSDTDFNSVSEFISTSYSVLSSPHLWIGVVAGAVMIFAAIKLRKYRDEG